LLIEKHRQHLRNNVDDKEKKNEKDKLNITPDKNYLGWHEKQNQ
jgi:hypothetical protein